MILNVMSHPCIPVLLCLGGVHGARGKEYEDLFLFVCLFVCVIV